MARQGLSSRLRAMAADLFVNSNWVCMDLIDAHSHTCVRAPTHTGATNMRNAHDQHVHCVVASTTHMPHEKNTRHSLLTQPRDTHSRPRTAAHQVVLGSV